jgi:acyl-CoA thioesterase-1
MNALSPFPCRRTCAGTLTVLLGLGMPAAFAQAGPAPRVALAVPEFPECPVAPVPAPGLPHTAAALAANKPLLVVAVGSSSTQGWMASDIAHSYPAILQATLNQTFPRADFAVVNRGIGGQDAAEELARLDTDVLAVRPQLVIWQVGANGALRDVDPSVFRRLVASGIAKIKAAGVDVILMDNQRTPRMIAAPENTRINEALAAVAAEQGVGLFARSALMDSWAADGHAMQEFAASDGLHMNDLGYRCVAHALAESITHGLEEVSP